MEIKLKKPIKHGEELIEVLELREPTAKDIKKLGLPINFGAQDINSEVVFKYIVDLAALPPSVIDQLGAVDFVACMGVVTGFFGESAD